MKTGLFEAFFTKPIYSVPFTGFQYGRTAAHTALNRRVSARDRPQSATPLPSAGSAASPAAPPSASYLFGGMEALVAKKGIHFDPVTREPGM